MDNYYIIKVSKKLSDYPTKIRVFKSKWDREIGETITFEGERWFVMSEGYDCQQECISARDRFVNHMLREGIWKSVRNTVNKF